MAARSRQRAVPEAPNLPHEFVTASAEFADNEWDGLIADETLSLPDVIYDLAMTECIWRGVDASERTLQSLSCRDVVFEQCHFGGAILDSAALTRVRFVECRLTGVVLSGAQLNDVVIEGGVADLANFRSSVSSLFWVSGTSMKETDFYRARLRKSALLDADLTAASFDTASIDGLSLHGSVVDSLQGASALTGGHVGIDADQLVSLGAAVLAEMGVRVTGRPEIT